MSETENNSQGKKPKVSKLAVASPLVVLSGFFIGVTLAACLKRYNFIAKIGIWTSMFSLLFGLIAGIIADHRICRSKGLLTGRSFSISGTILSLILIISLLIPTGHPPREYALRVVCSVNLKSLGEAMQTYASNFGNKYPAADKWCDLLLQNTKITEKHFVCRGAFRKGDKGRCHYAMNPNCEPNSPPDIVLLFETKGGWNQFGGPELLTFENHKGKGCSILFNDGHVESIEPYELDKLKWDVGEARNSPAESEGKL